MQQAITATELAERLKLKLQGAGDVVLKQVASLGKARAGDLTFFVNPAYMDALQQTRASAVILKPEHAEQCPVTAILADDPYLTYARAAQQIYPLAPASPGIHPSAIIGSNCHISDAASIGPLCVLGDGVTIAEGASLGANVIIEDDVNIGAFSRIGPRVSLLQGVMIGARCVIHAGAVIGGQGFGYANDGGEWVSIPQVGSVRIGDDVDIGCNTTIDRGAIEDTVIENGVKLDNQIQVAHNVRIGAHTAIAACTGIAGSATIGKYCAIGGGAGVVGHLKIADHVTITGMTFVAHNIETPGSYSSGVPMQTTTGWRKNYVRFRQLDDIARRLKKLERKLSSSDEGSEK